jgi:dipeptidyl aminopeptidase/acylaminoacyl peptidase
VRQILIIGLLLGLTFTVAAQTKAPAIPADYGQWERLSAQFGSFSGGRYMSSGGLSPDGKWVVYSIDRSNHNNELRFTHLGDGSTKVVAFGAQPEFSSDSRWVAYSIGYSEAQEEKLNKEKKPVQKKLGLMNLSNGEQIVVEDVESFSFSPNGAYIAMRRYPPQKKEVPEADAEESDGGPGTTLVVRQLNNGRDTAFGNVSEYAWQDRPRRGRLLALAISADEKTGNGVQLFDPETGTLRVLDSSPAIYSELAWRKDSSDLAVLRSKSDEHHEGPTHVVLAWTRLSDGGEAKYTYDPTGDSRFPVGMRTVTFRRPSWSEDGQVVFLGIAKWAEKLPEPKKTSGGENDKTDAAAQEVVEPAGVEIWHWRDLDVMPKQQFNNKSDRQKNMLAAWHIDSGQFVQLGKNLFEEVRPIEHQKAAVAVNWEAYAMDRTIGRPAADLYLVDLANGDRTEIKDDIIGLGAISGVQVSPDGRYLLYVQDDNYWTVDVTSHAVVNITKNVQTSFIDKESDATVKQKKSFGVAGWTKDGSDVILYDKFDLWQLAPDGSHATRLTDGATEQIRHRLVVLNSEDEWIETDKPLYLSLFGIWTKKSGYARLAHGAKSDEHLIWVDKQVDELAKAKDADVYEYVTQSFEVSPNIFVGGPDLKDAKQVTKTNPFQSNYAWGHEELIDYKNERGEHLQAALYYPAGYEPGKKYPMIAYIYERESDLLHYYRAPSQRGYYNGYYNVGAMSSHGYFVLEPDIAFRSREPGLSVVDCVTAAVKKVLQMDVVDPQKVGVMGHSWGGFDTTFLATHTDIFAAAVAGAPITDLVSNYGNHHWSGGIAETDHIETGQQRMVVPLYEDIQAYIRNSAIFTAQNMKTPLMIEVGDNDGVVFWHQGVELYNIARRAGKNIVLLQYAGENHGLRKKANVMDYQRRIFEWFGYYLKGEPAPSWITDGESYLEREREVKRLKLQSGTN